MDDCRSGMGQAPPGRLAGNLRPRSVRATRTEQRQANTRFQHGRPRGDYLGFSPTFRPVGAFPHLATTRARAASDNGVILRLMQRIGCFASGATRHR